MNFASRTMFHCVDHGAGRCQNRHMLRHGDFLQPEHQNVARLGRLRRLFLQMLPCTEQQSLSRLAFRPVGRIGRHLLGLRAAQLTVNAAHEPKTIAAHPFEACLMVVGRTEPLACNLNDARPQNTQEKRLPPSLRGSSLLG